MTALSNPELFGAHVDLLTLDRASSLIANACISSTSMQYVVTPNLDHLVSLRKDYVFRSAYADAAFTLADGWPVVAACRLLGHPVPERVAGSDLVPAVLHYAHEHEMPLSVFILGGLGDVPNRAADFVTRSFPSLRIAGCYSPPLGFENDPLENNKIVEVINASDANFIVLGLGTPKQEKWIHRHRSKLRPGIAVCGGATVDFLAGSVRRAPRWMRSAGLEWLHRLATDPGRLTVRYAKDAAALPLLLVHEAVRRSRIRPR